MRRERQRRPVWSVTLAVCACAAAATIAVTIGDVDGHQRTPKLASGHVTLLAAAGGAAQTTAAVGADGSGWALTSSGLDVTQDAGRTFSLVTLPVPVADVEDVFTSTAETAVVARIESAESVSIEVALSPNGGKTWTTTTLPAGGGTPGSAMFVANGEALIGVIVTNETSSNFSSGDWYATNDGGATWTHYAAPSGGVVASAGGRLWLVGGWLHDALYASTDDGATWARVTLPTSIAIGTGLTVAGAFTDGSVALVAAQPSGDGSSNTPSTATVYTTNDGGATWKTVAQAATGNGSIAPGVATAAWLTANTLWLAPPLAGVVDRVSENGVVFSASIQGGSPDIVGLTASSGSAAWVVAQASSCPAGKASCAETSSLFATTNGGQGWSQLSLATAGT